MIKLKEIGEHGYTRVLLTGHLQDRLMIGDIRRHLPHSEEIWNYELAEVADRLGIPQATFLRAMVWIKAHEITLEEKDEDLELGEDWISIQATRAELRKATYEMATELAQGVWDVGGDDDYFDYFPNAYFLVRDLGEALNMDQDPNELKDMGEWSQRTWYQKAMKYIKENYRRMAKEVGEDPINGDWEASNETL